MIFFQTRRRQPVCGTGGYPSGDGRRGCRALLVAIALCSFPQALHAMPAAADPDARVPRTTYRPVIESYTPFRPVEPSPWADVNRQVTPKPKPKPQGDSQR